MEVMDEVWAKVPCATAGTAGTRHHARRPFYADDGGYTTIGMLLALMLTVALLFAAANVYWLDSNSADIQFAADAGALAAQNVVGEYMIAARLADAVAFSMGVTGLTLYAASAVLACIPPTQAVAADLLEAGQKVMHAQREFAKTASESLDELQTVLPYLCVLASSTTISANGNASTVHAQYLGLAIPLPLKGKAVEYHDASDEDFHGTVQANNEKAKEGSEEAERAQRDMDAALLEAWRADCGDPSHNMYERSGKLAGLSGSVNPYYSSVETWSFSVAARRAVSYYQERFDRERLQAGNDEELSRQMARRVFYEHAVTLCLGFYTRTHDDGSQTVHFEPLPQTLADFKSSPLYTQKRYPLSVDASGAITLHCSSLCSGCGDVVGYGALRDIDQGMASRCPKCRFDLNTLEQVVHMTSRVDTGFEYHYARLVRAADEYSAASKRKAKAELATKKATRDSIDTYLEALKSFTMRRYDPLPPGRYGCVCVVIDPRSHSAPVNLGLFTGQEARMDARIAISAAMLAPDAAESGDNVIASLFAGIHNDGRSWGSKVLGDVMDLWGDLLLAYSHGSDALMNGICTLLDHFPSIGTFNLSKWARKTLEQGIELLGLQPVKMESLKPVLVNSARVLEKDDSELAQGVIRLKTYYSTLPGSGSGDLVEVLASGLGSYLRAEADKALEASYTVGRVQLLGQTIFEFKLSLPDFFVQEGKQAFEHLERELQGLVRREGAGSRWE
ncbi:MAG: hypothetical protein IJH83_02210 [Coriobacteriales bacterium]|nr:hypothetical protein [Coriobacteriales bacterium]